MRYFTPCSHLAIIVLTYGLPQSAYAEGATSQVCGYTLDTSAPLVATLGSSYSAGPGLYKNAGWLLADLLAADLGLDKPYNNYANCSKSAKNITDVPTHTPQLQNLDYKAVLITGGGNDLNYVACLYSPGAPYCGQTISKADYLDRYMRALNSTRDYTSTGTPIYVVTYIKAIGDSLVCDGDSHGICNLDSEQAATAKQIYNNVVDWTVDAYNAFKSANGDRVVKMITMRAYTGTAHTVNATAPWINGNIAPAPNDGATWHPNAAGHKFIAQAVYNDLHGLAAPPH